MKVKDLITVRDSQIKGRRLEVADPSLKKAKQEDLEALESRLHRSTGSRFKQDGSSLDQARNMITAASSATEGGSCVGLGINDSLGV